MSIRFRLTLLYSVILVATLVAAGVATYLVVSQISMNLATDALNTEAKSLAMTTRPFADPNQGGQVSIIPPNIGPGDSQTFIQVRGADGKVKYQSPNLKSTGETLPASAKSTDLRPGGDMQHSIVTFNDRRFIVYTAPLAFRDQIVGQLQVARTLQDVDQTLSTLREVLLLSGAIAVLVACGAGWLLAGTALSPIRRIARSAQDIGESQDFGRRVSYDGPRDEIGRLATTLNTMLVRLQDAYQTQRRFVADASHELRTPLTSIRGNLGLLQLDPPIAEVDRVAVMDDLVSESERLSRLVADLLTLARNDAGRPLLNEPVAVRPLVSNVARLMNASHPERTIDLEGSLDVTVAGDADALTQVLLILLDNAQKFTPQDGEIAILVDADQHQVSIGVRDTGAGIPPDDVSRIFDRFYQADTARAEAGSGLGLAIAKALVGRHGGTIGVTSEVGHGSTFTITLPRSAAAPAS